MMEEYRDIKGYEGYYEISNLGNVRSKSYKGIKILKPGKTSNGYLKVALCVGQVRKQVNIHRIVAETFIDNPNNYPVVNHKDCNKENNNVNNLEWCSIDYNNSHALANGRLQRYENRPQAKMTKEKVLMIPHYISQGATTDDLANLFGVSRRAIDNIFEGKNWKGLGIDFTKLKPVRKIKGIESKFKANTVLN